MLKVVEMRTDCDQDVVWLRVRVEGDGLACHTGRRSCFYRFVPVQGASGRATHLLLAPDAEAPSEALSHFRSCDCSAAILRRSARLPAS